jgi:hypothetical protein
MPTLQRAANQHSIVSTGWTNPGNAQSATGDNVYATTLNGSTTKNLNHVGDFGFANIDSAAIPDGSTIDAVRIRCEADLSATGVGVLFGVLGRISGADSGSETTKTTTGEEEVIATLSGVTLANLRSASTVVKARCRGAKGNTASAFTVFLDYVRLEIDYTEASSDFNGSASASFAFTASGTGNYEPAVYNGTGTASLVISASATGSAPSGFDPPNAQVVIDGTTAHLTWDESPLLGG